MYSISSIRFLFKSLYAYIYNYFIPACNYTVVKKGRWIAIFNIRHMGKDYKYYIPYSMIATPTKYTVEYIDGTRADITPPFGFPLLCTAKDFDALTIYQENMDE